MFIESTYLPIMSIFYIQIDMNAIFECVRVDYLRENRHILKFRID